MAKLTGAQVEAYRRDGYVLYHDQLFKPDEMERLRTIFEEQLAQKGEKLSDELDTPHFRDARLLQFLMDDKVLDLVEPITGKDIVLWSSHFICKDPFIGRATPWHEDSAFWEGRLTGYDNIVTVWLALDRSNKENGCMSVVPGTHSNGFSKYTEADLSRNTFRRQIAETVDESKVVYFELEPGECSLHDAKIVHGAKPNTSRHRRCGYTMRYLPAANRVVPEKNPGHKVWLARGRPHEHGIYENV